MEDGLTFQQKKHRANRPPVFRRRPPRTPGDPNHFLARWRRKYPEKARAAYERNRVGTKRYFDRMREFLWQQKQVPCFDCGLVEPAIMEFDHARGVKTIGIMELKVGWTKLLAELEKCDVVCPNCHARRTNARKVALI